MASIFLSYVRKDEPRARALAALLEDAGHSVWWDRHLTGGAQFTDEIEAALKAADKVLVLWSAGAVRSPWVRDEAAVGRDSGRLIPTTLDGTPPPLGFRQFQTIDLSKWRGRGSPANWSKLMDAIAATTMVEDPNAHLAVPARRVSGRQLLVAAIVVLLAAAAFSVFLLGRDDGSSATVGLIAADSDPRSAAAARELGIKLGSSENGTLDRFRFVSDPKRASSSRFRLEVAGRLSGGLATRDLTLINGADDAILWAGHFELPASRASELSAQASTTAAQVLSCAIDTFADAATLPAASVKLYLTGCSRLPKEYDETTSNLPQLFEKVVRGTPKFAPAWDKLLYAEAIQADGLPNSPVLPQLRRHVAEARRAGVDTGSLYVAQAALLPSNRFFDRMKLLEQGLSRHPGDPLIHAKLSDWLMRVGRHNDAVTHARTATELDPYSPAAHMRFVWTLAHSGKPGALAELRKAEALWPGAANIELARFSYELRYGDPKVALRMVREGTSRWGQESLVAFLEARIAPTKANVDRSVGFEVDQARQIPEYISGVVTTLATFGRDREAIDALLAYRRIDAAGFNSEGWFRSATRGMRRDPRFIQAMAHVGLLDYWARSEKWPDFCFDSSLPYDCRVEAKKYL